MIIKAAKRIFNSDKICHSYSDLNFGVTFVGTQCTTNIISTAAACHTGNQVVVEFNIPLSALSVILETSRKQIT